ncbi:hypothetical protein Tco_0718340 [Tanacetum coccineum]
MKLGSSSIAIKAYGFFEEWRKNQYPRRGVRVGEEFETIRLFNSVKGLLYATNVGDIERTSWRSISLLAQLFNEVDSVCRLLIVTYPGVSSKLDRSTYGKSNTRARKLDYLEIGHLRCFLLLVGSIVSFVTSAAACETILLDFVTINVALVAGNFCSATSGKKTAGVEELVLTLATTALLRD